MRWLCGLCLFLWVLPLAAKSSYEVEYLLSFDAKSKVVRGEIRLGKGADRVRGLNLKFGKAYSQIKADGTLKAEGERMLWTPPKQGGSLRYQVRIDEKRADGTYRSYFPGDWAIFRGDRVFPSARVRAVKGARADARLRFDLPKGWHVDTPYFPAPDGRFLVEDPDRNFDRPVGWMAVGEIGTRREVIAGTEIALAAPKGEGMRRLDTLALLNYNLPAMKDAFGSLPAKILIVSAPDPMWRGGLSAPRSLFLHLDRPMLSENATSTLLHELTHVATRIRGQAPQDDWLAEGIAEFYGVELLHRTGGITDERLARLEDDLRQWSGKVKSLRVPRSYGPITARATLLLFAVDREIRERSKDRRSLDDVTRILIRERKVSTAEFIAACEKIVGGKLKTLDTPLLR